MKRLILIIAIIVLSPCLGFAATHYIRPSGGGGGGTTWTDAYNGLPAALTRGDTYVLAGGTYTSSYTFDDTEDGTTYIYIRKASSALDSGVAGWQASYSSDQAVFSPTTSPIWELSTGYYDIDGLTPTEKWQTSGHGIKLTPGNPNQTNWCLHTGTSAVGTSILKHIAFINPGPSYDYEQRGILSADYPNLTLQYCYFYNSEVHIAFSGGDGWILEYSYIDQNWSSSDHHGESIAIVTAGSHHIRYNFFNHADVGTGCIMTFGAYPTGQDNVQIYGNIFYDMSYGGNGVIGTADSGNPPQMNNWKVYNNTFINSDDVKLSVNNESSGWEIKNNLFYGCVVSFFEGMTGPASSTYNNNYTNNTTYGWTAGAQDVTSTEATSVLFTNYAGGDYTLGLGSQARNAGANLGASYNTDPDGNTRGADGTWDIGAYEYGAGGDTTPPTVKGVTIKGGTWQ